MCKENCEECNAILESENIDLRELREIAIYLEGVKKGKGNLLPLGISHLNTLWKAIYKLRNIID